MSLVSFALTGAGFILIGSLQSLLTSQSNKLNKLFHITLSIFTSFITLSSIISILISHTSNDAVALPLHLQTLPISSLFLIHSLLSLFLPFLPSPLLNLIIAFGFAEEFLLFYLQRKDPTGIENRYYDLLLVPIAVCVFSTLLELGSYESNVPKLGRGIGLILQGTWFVQMGLSLFSSNFVAEGCNLHSVSKGNYSLRCKGHPEYHRARAIATLQFNCHLALMVVVLVAFYSFTCGKIGDLGRNSTEGLKYTPLGAEMHSLENSVENFTLDSDEEEEEEEVKDGNAGSEKVINGVNGNSSYH
ncbi:uncharacterized protein LOC131635143 [Vicia villosa]|uniref:uncharacterized protein LOC131635143 n=1 Tax=Vicia villosa TaxID=3911 RepID=UPI00273C125D|nr:uncharacterized protein LOC131635143 [Vicia villosa]